MGKIDDIYLSTLCGNFDIFACTESWFNSSIPDEIVKLPNYRTFRHDRQKRIGGGVCVWIRSSIQVKQLYPEKHPISFEAVWLCLPESQLLFVCLYIPPDVAISHQRVINTYIIDNFDKFLTTYVNYNTVICGDLNKLNTSEITTNLDVINMIFEPTRKESFLDYMLVSSAIKQDYDVTVSSPIANSDHKSTSVYWLNKRFA